MDGSFRKEDEPSSGLHIQILVEGCPQCRQMEKSVLELLSEMNLPAGVDHVTEPREIAKYGSRCNWNRDLKNKTKYGESCNENE